MNSAGMVISFMVGDLHLMLFQTGHQPDVVGRGQICWNWCQLEFDRFVNTMLWRHTGRTGFDSNIPTFMARVCGFVKESHPLPQVKTITLLLWN
jgi:hypothetical protein